MAWPFAWGFCISCQGVIEEAGIQAEGVQGVRGYACEITYNLQP